MLNTKTRTGKERNAAKATKKMQTLYVSVSNISRKSTNSAPVPNLLIHLYCFIAIARERANLCTSLSVMSQVGRLRAGRRRVPDDDSRLQTDVREHGRQLQVRVRAGIPTTHGRTHLQR